MPRPPAAEKLEHWELAVERALAKKILCPPPRRPPLHVAPPNTTASSPAPPLPCCPPPAASSIPICSRGGTARPHRQHLANSLCGPSLGRPPHRPLFLATSTSSPKQRRLLPPTAGLVTGFTAPRQTSAAACSASRRQAAAPVSPSSARSRPPQASSAAHVCPTWTGRAQARLFYSRGSGREDPM
jgi:hypothetical protein